MGSAGAARMMRIGISLAVIVCAQGCASLGGESTTLTAWLLPGGASPPEAPVGPKVTVVIKPTDAKPRVAELPLKENMLVHDALKQSGAYREFGRMKVRLARKDPHGGGEHVMGVSFDHVADRVPESSNYAMYDGDRLIVEQEDVAMTTEVLDAVLGPIGRLTAR